MEGLSSKELLELIPSDILAKSLTVAVFRNGLIEDMHADKSKNLGQSDMKALNIDVCNRLYEIIEMYRAVLSGDEQAGEDLLKTISYSSLCATNWNQPKNMHKFKVSSFK